MRKNYKTTGKFLVSLVTLLAISVGHAFAQLTVTPNQTAVQLVNKFVGTGVTVANQTLTCPGGNNGIFTAVNTNLGLSGGVLLCTGDVMDVGKPAGTQIGQAAPFNTPGDADLNAIINNNNTYDACVLAFDFTPDIDTSTLLHFSYVFGSDEYPTFACSQYNDVFAFMMTGLNFAPNQNVALVPNTTIPVSINSINDGTSPNIAVCNAVGPGSPFTAYYIDNQFGGTIAFNGFTKVLDAQARLEPCQTYHLKLAIQNVGDEGYQSGVFLKENSFIVDTATLDANGFVHSSGDYLIEGCTPLELTFARDKPQPRRKKICLEIAGTATNGVDYPFLPDSVIIQPNSAATIVTVNPIQDGIVEPVETIVIRMVSCCDGTIKDSISLSIRDSLYMDIVTHDTLFCENKAKSTELHVTGDTVYSYQWTPANGVHDPTDTLTYTDPIPTQTTTYTCTATYPGCPPVTRSATVILEALPVVDISPADVAICVNDTLQLMGSASPPSSLYHYQWYPASNQYNAWISDDTIAAPLFSTPSAVQNIYVLRVTSQNGCQNTDTVRVRGKFVPFVYTTPDYAGFCTHQDSQFHALVYPVYPPDGGEYTYSWSPAIHLSNPNIKEPVYHSDTVDYNNYTLTVTTPEGCSSSDNVEIQTYTVPTAYIDFIDTTVCLYDSMKIVVNVFPRDSTPSYQYSWTPGNNLGDTTAMEPYFYSEKYESTFMHLTVTSPEGCLAQDSAIVRSSQHVHITATPDRTIQYGNSVHLNAEGSYHYFWTPGRDMDNANIKDPIVRPTEPTMYTVYAMDSVGKCRDTAQTFIDIDYEMVDNIPTAFTPNFDGKNDKFRLTNLKFQRLLEFRVYNRWGQQVFATTDANDGWDGTYKGQACDAGVYGYVIRVSRPDGTTRTYTGDVTLLR